MNASLSPHARANRRERRWIKLGGIASGLMLAVSGLHGPLPVAAQTVAPMTDRPLERIDDRVLGHDPRLDDVFVRGFDDRQFDMLDHLLNLSTGTARLEGLDDILSQARSLGFDDQDVADMLVSIDVQQEDRQNDRQLEVNDDRPAGQADQDVQPGDVRQEDRAAETGDVRQEDRGTRQQVQPGDVRQEDRAAETGDVRREDRPATQTRGADDGAATYYTAPASPAAAPAAASPSTSSSTTSSSITSSSSTSSASSSSSRSAGSTSSPTASHSGGHDDPSGHH